MSQHKKVGDYWSGVTRSNAAKAGGIKRWWQSDVVVGLINERVCGERIPGQSAGMVRRFLSLLRENGQRLRRGVSVGGGAGQKEMLLLDQGVVDRMVIYELSKERIRRGRELAARRGLDSRIEFVYGDAFKEVARPGVFDLVHWNNALHHMDDVAQAVQWSRHVLCAGGYFYMDDFVGATRFQWSDAELAAANRIRRRLLDTTYLAHPDDPSRYLAGKVTRPDIDKMIEIDPSEAADSARIVDAVREVFPHSELLYTGGVVYSLALKNLIQNFETNEGRLLLEIFMELDFALADAGLSHYAVAWSRIP